MWKLISMKSNFCEVIFWCLYISEIKCGQMIFIQRKLSTDYVQKIMQLVVKCYFYERNKHKGKWMRNMWGECQWKGRLSDANGEKISCWSLKCSCWFTAHRTEDMKIRNTLRQSDISNRCSIAHNDLISHNGQRRLASGYRHFKKWFELNAKEDIRHEALERSFRLFKTQLIWAPLEESYKLHSSEVWSRK